MAAAVQKVTGAHVTLAFSDEGYTGEQPATASAVHAVALQMIKLSDGCVLLSHHWEVERSLAWATRFRRPAKGYERLAETVADLHLLAVACL